MWSRWTCWLAAVLLISACSHGTRTRVVRTDGTAVVGELVAARPDAVVIKVADGTTVTIPRSVIRAVESAPAETVASAASSSTTQSSNPQSSNPPAANAPDGRTAPSSSTSTPPEGKSAGTTSGGNPSIVSSAATTSGANSGSSGRGPSNGGSSSGVSSGGASGGTGGPATIARDVVAPSGTTLELSLSTAIGSDTSAVDDKVDAVLRSPLTVNGEAVLNAGAMARGVIIEATPAARADGHGRLAVRFDAIQVGPRSLQIQAAPVRWEAPGVGRRAPPPPEQHGLFHNLVRKTKKGLHIGDDGSPARPGSAEVRFLPGALVRIRLEQPAHIAP